MSDAATGAGFDRRADLYERRRVDERFAERWDEIVERSTEQMEAEAYRRAVDGWIERQEFAINEAGEQVPTLTVRKFSDTLLIFMLKARRPDTYRENVKHEHSGPEGGPIAAEIVTVTPKEAADAAHDFLARVSGPAA